MTLSPRASVGLLALVMTACGGSSQNSKAPALAPANPQAVGKMAKGVTAARDAKDQTRAISMFRSAIAADPELWEARFNLAVVLANSGQLDDAEKELSKAADLAPNAEDVLVALSEVRRRRGDASGAVSALASFVQKHPDAVVARTALVSALREDGEIDKAIEQAQEVLVRRAGDPNALSELALLYLDKDEIDTAELLSKEALKAEQKSAVAARTAGLIALEKGDDAVAFRHFMQATELDPADTTARLNIGTVLIRAGVYERAKLEFEAVLERAPNDMDALLGLAAALRGTATRDNQGAYAEAERSLKRVLEINGRHPDATFNLGVLYADFLKKPKLARKMLEHFLDNAPRAHQARAAAKKMLVSLK